jgi:hypothetical protein
VRGRPYVLLVGLLAVVSGCTRYWAARFGSPAHYTEIDLAAPFAKCHTADGGVTVLAGWTIDAAAQRIRGTGIAYDADRRELQRGPFELAFDRVVLVETNRPEEFVSPGIVTLGVVTGASLAVTIACAVNPKSCFGSCPTFYVPGSGGEWELAAEGFSASIASTLEATDVDALPGARVEPGQRELVVRMTNEALETHLVRGVRLVAVPRQGASRVVQHAGRFFRVQASHPALSCAGPDGEDCLAAIARQDGVERLSATDGHDLARREELEIGFPPARGRLAVVLTARNSLLNTFLFYQSLAYMGPWAGDWIRLLERKPELAQKATGMGDALGGLDLSVLSRSGWRAIGTYDEIGPLAREVQAFPITESVELPEGPIRVRIGGARGNHRLDEVLLAEVSEAEAPLTIAPSVVRRGGVEDPEALARLLGRGPRLMTVPGDAYLLSFTLPSELADPELFLESTGYYYEWTRTGWLDEEDASRLAEVIEEPRKALVRLAPAFKAIESKIETIFWQSRIGPNARSQEPAP